MCPTTKTPAQTLHNLLSLCITLTTTCPWTLQTPPLTLLTHLSSELTELRSELTCLEIGWRERYVDRVTNELSDVLFTSLLLLCKISRVHGIKITSVIKSCTSKLEMRAPYVFNNEKVTIKEARGMWKEGKVKGRKEEVSRWEEDVTAMLKNSPPGSSLLHLLKLKICRFKMLEVWLRVREKFVGGGVWNSLAVYGGWKVVEGVARVLKGVLGG